MVGTSIWFFMTFLYFLMRCVLATILTYIFEIHCIIDNSRSFSLKWVSNVILYSQNPMYEQSHWEHLLQRMTFDWEELCCQVAVLQLCLSYCWAHRKVYNCYNKRESTQCIYLYRGLSISIILLYLLLL